MIDYVILANSNGSLSKRFYLEKFDADQKRSEVRETLSSGRTHLIRGRNQPVYGVTFLIPETSSDLDYGDLDDLEQLHGYDMPDAIPSDVLTLTLFDESVHQVRWLGDFQPRPAGVVLYGELAYYTVAAELIDITAPELDFSEPDYSMYLALI